MILSAARRADAFDWEGDDITTSVLVLRRTISPGILKVFLRFLVSLIFFYFSVNFLVAVWVFLPGCNSAVVSKVFIVPSLLLISSSFVSASIAAGGGLL